MALIKKTAKKKAAKPEKEQRLTIQPVGGPWRAKPKKKAAGKKK